jgi:hypothetical protein
MSCWPKVGIMRNCIRLILGTSRWSTGRGEGWVCGERRGEMAVVSPLYLSFTLFRDVRKIRPLLPILLQSPRSLNGGWTSVSHPTVTFKIPTTIYLGSNLFEL